MMHSTNLLTYLVECIGLWTIGVHDRV